MGARTSEFDPIIPESCTLENFKKMKLVFEKKIKEYDDRLKTLQQTMKSQLEAGSEEAARNTSIQKKQLEIVRGIYLKVLPDIVGSILLIEESEPMITLLEMMPTTKYDIRLDGEKRADPKKAVFLAIANAFGDNLGDNVFDLTGVSEVTCWKGHLIKKLITAPKTPPPEAAANKDKVVKKDKDVKKKIKLILHIK